MRQILLSLVLVVAVACSNDAVVPESRPSPAASDAESGREGRSKGGSGPHARHQLRQVSGRLSGSSRNVRLVAKLQLTDSSGGISDVAAFGDYAYVGSFQPECRSTGGDGTGVHVVDIRDPSRPRKAAFVPTHDNSYVGEGVHVIHADTRFFSGEILIHNNEPCDDDEPFMGGVSLWDVSQPTDPRVLARGVGDNTPSKSPNINGVSSSHSAQGFTIGHRAYVVLVDNEERANVDILDITNPRSPRQIAEVDLRDWPSAQSHTGNGGTIYHHDMQTKRIDGHTYLLLSYWDAGWILLNVDDPSKPRFVEDYDYPLRDPLIPSVPPGGNAHEAFWSSDDRFILATEEDFSPRSMILRVGRASFPADRFGWSASLPGGLEGIAVWGGSGCDEDLDGDSRVDSAEVPRASDGGGPATAIVFGRGSCFFSQKVETGQEAGYDVVLIGQSHEATLNGQLPDAFTCGAQGHDFDVTVPALCIGHRALHRLFADPPDYEGPEPFAASGDMPRVGTRGRRFSAPTVFDGWGYIHLLDADTLEDIDTYSIPQALNPKFATGFGVLSVHEIKTDPRLGVNLAYSSYYKAGLRVLSFGEEGLREVGHYVSRQGNNFWGTFPHIIGTDPRSPRVASMPAKPYLLMSDRDSGLWIFRYTGPVPG